MRPPPGSTAARPAATESNGTPFARATAAGEGGVDHLVRAPKREADGARSPWRVEHERRAQLVVEHHGPGADLGVPAGPTATSTTRICGAP